MKHKVVIAYCIIFYVLMIYKLLNGMFMYQMQPFFFYNRMDIFTWLFMQTKLQQQIIQNKGSQMLMDAAFYTIPLIYFLSFQFNKKLASAICIIMLLVNFFYVECYTLFPTTSVEGYIVWLLFPIAFLPNNEKTFALLFKGLRYFFLFFFFSSGVWKFVQGGIFHTDEMSNILLSQHKEMLSNSPNFWQTKFIFFLIKHQTLSYCLYILSAVAELSFAIGFFTKKIDRLLAFIFVLFLLFDYFIMRISYFEVMPFLITLLCNRHLKTFINNDKISLTAEI